MRKRRLYRNSLISPIHPRRMHVPPEQAAEQTNSHQIAFESGIRHGMQISASQQRHLVQQAQQHALALASHSESRIARARQDGFDRGYAAGMEARSPQAEKPSSKGSYTYADVEAARARGFEAGRREYQRAAVTDESAIRKKLVDEMIEQCRVISESNPNMAPGVNAVRHRLKKLA